MNSENNLHNQDHNPLNMEVQPLEAQPPAAVVMIDQQHPSVIGVHDPPVIQIPHSRQKRARVYQSEARNFKLKEFGVLLITKNTDIVNDVYSYRTTTFNAPVVKEWACKNQMPHYLSTLFNGPDNNHRIINKVASVQVIANSDQISVNDESGAASLGWTDKNADVSINVTSHIW